MMRTAEPRRSANTGETTYAMNWHGAVVFADGKRTRRWMTLEEAERGDSPKPFSPMEWRAMAQQSERLHRNALREVIGS